MNNRIWDPLDKYADAVLKEYTHWFLELSFRQHTLGCFIVFAKRKVERISELETKELTELREVMKDIETALTNIPEMKPDRFNYLQLGNNLNHLHLHGIPRYAAPRNCAGHEWLDPTWGHPPVWTKTVTDRETVLTIKKKILAQL